MAVDLKQLVADVHKNAVEHGWWEEPRSFGDVISLMHSELSEALEEYRKGRGYGEVYYTYEHNVNVAGEGDSNCKACQYQYGKPEGIPTELADCVIRIMDACGEYGIDLEDVLLEKHRYNKTRPYRHGGKVM